MDNVTIKTISSLEKIYREDNGPFEILSEFSMLKNEKKSFQIIIESDIEFNGVLTINTNIASKHLYSVEHIKSDLPMSKGSDNFYRFSKDGYYPDLLLPINNNINIKKGINVFWLEISDAEDCVGKNEVKISISKNNLTLAKTSINIEVIDCYLDFNDFIYTCWFHTDCLIKHYNIEVFSTEYWNITENFLKTSADYGMTCVLTPIFTPPLDTEFGKERPTVQLIDVTVDNGEYKFNFDNLTKWIDMAHRCGIKYFEMAHFFTQWGARHAPKIMATVNGEYKQIFGWSTKATSKQYTTFLRKLSFELKRYFEDKNIQDKVLLHVSDEPNLSCLRPYFKASRLIHQLYKGYRIVDALSDIWFYKLGIVTTPISSNDHIDKFIGKTNELWTYYCSAQTMKNVSNRFFCNTSLRTRVLGYQLFKFDVRGFLHWGYNFYFTQLSRAVIDPYKVSDAGGAFPSGDSYIVYPAPDGTAYHSIRLKVFFDALQDMAALNTLTKLTNKKECIAIIEENGKHSITFSEYPHSEKWLLETREKINLKIKESLK